METDIVLVHTSISCNSNFCNSFAETNRNENIFDYLLKHGLLKPIEDRRFDPNDQPISYYANDGLNLNMVDGDEDKVFTDCSSLFNIVIYFHKPRNEIFVERKNDACYCRSGDECLFCKGMHDDVRLSDFPTKPVGCYDPDMLYGFAVRNIKPEEIRSICLYTVNDGDSGWLLYKIKSDRRQNENSE